MSKDVHVQSMSNYFDNMYKQQKEKANELKEFRTEVMADPEKYADIMVSNIKKQKQKNPYGIGVPVGVTYTTQDEIKEKMLGKDLLQMLYSIQDEAKGVYGSNVKQSHWSMVAKEKTEKAQATYKSCEKAINKLKEVL